jgi:hypothetical protein
MPADTTDGHHNIIRVDWKMLPSVSRSWQRPAPIFWFFATIAGLSICQRCFQVANMGCLLAPVIAWAREKSPTRRELVARLEHSGFQLEFADLAEHSR